jgi:hypothetical protein
MTSTTHIKVTIIKHKKKKNKYNFLYLSAYLVPHTFLQKVGKKIYYHTTDPILVSNSNITFTFWNTLE